MILLAVGFTFVNVSNLGNFRDSIWMSRDGTYKDIKILMKLGAILYFMSPIIFMRSKYDMDGYCPHPERGIKLTPPAKELGEDPWFILMSGL
jgi:hypothetical protein